MKEDLREKVFKFRISYPLKLLIKIENRITEFQAFKISKKKNSIFYKYFHQKVLDDILHQNEGIN